MFSLLLGTHRRVEMLGHMGSLFWLFEGQLNSFPKQVPHVICPPAMYVHILTCTCYCTYFHRSHLMGVKCILLSVDFHSRMTNGTEYLFMCRFSYEHHFQINLVKGNGVPVCVKTAVSLFLFNQMNMVQIAADICKQSHLLYTATGSHRPAGAGRRLTLPIALCSSSRRVGRTETTR